MMLLNLPIEQLVIIDTCYSERLLDPLALQGYQAAPYIYNNYVIVRSISLWFLFCLCPYYFLSILSRTAIVMYVFQVITSHTSPVIKGSVMHQEKKSLRMQVWTLINKGRSLEVLPHTHTHTHTKHQKLQILKILATNYRSTPSRL